MLTLFRGGPTIWMSNVDAEKAGIKDNDWVEAYNRNGTVTARAVVSHRMPEGTMYMYHAQIWKFKNHYLVLQVIVEEVITLLRRSI